MIADFLAGYRSKTRLSESAGDVWFVLGVHVDDMPSLRPNCKQAQ